MIFKQAGSILFKQSYFKFQYLISCFCLILSHIKGHVAITFKHVDMGRNTFYIQIILNLFLGHDSEFVPRSHQILH